MSKFPGVVSVLAAVLFLSGFHAALAATPVEPRVYVDASSNNFPPMNFLDQDGNLTGFGRELADAVAREAGLKVEHIHSKNWVEVLDWLKKGKADFIHDTGYTLERDAYLDYTKPIIEMPEVIFVRNEEFAITGFNSLKGVKVACVKEHISHIYLRQFPDISISLVDTPVEGIYELVAGGVDAFVYPKQVALYLAQNVRLADKVKIAGEPLRTLTWGMVVREGNAGLLESLNDGLAKVRKSGEYERIYNRWWGERALSGYTKREVFIITGAVAFACAGLVLLIGLFLHNRSLSARRRMLEEEMARRILATEKLRESEEKLRVVAETIKEIFWIVSADGKKIHYISPAFEEVWGIPAKSLMDNPGSWLDAIHPDDRDAIIKIVMQKAAEGYSDPQFPAYRVIRPDGTSRWVLARVFPYLDKNGDVIHLVGIAEDITDRKKKEYEMTRLESELQQARKMEAVGTLAGGIAHDFNNILSALIGYTELARDEFGENISAKEYLESVLQAADRAKNLVRQILTFSRKGSEVKEPLQPAFIIKEGLKLLRASLPSSIEIRGEIDSGSGTVLANPTNIHQVLVNLCTNAQHAMTDEKGVITVKLERTELSGNDPALTGNPAGPYLKLTVSDTGCGMDEEVRGRIFDPYFTTKEPGKGTGLGLSLVHGIVQDCGGFIKVESEPGRGSSFQVYLPALEIEAALPKIQEAEPPRGNERLMVVDDEEAISTMYKEILERQGYVVTAHTSAIKALEEFRRSPESFDLIISDQTMPGLTGVELVKEILQLRPGFPIIICTGYSSVISEEAALSIGARRLMTKPISRKEMLLAIRRELDRAKSAEV